MLVLVMIANWAIALAGVGLFLLSSHKFAMISILLVMAGVGGAYLSMMSLDKIKKRYYRYCLKLVMDNPDNILLRFYDQDRDIIITEEALFKGKSMFTFDSAHEKLVRVKIDQRLYPPEAIFRFVRTTPRFLPAKNVAVNIPVEHLPRLEEIVEQLKKRYGIGKI